MIGRGTKVLLGVCTFIQLPGLVLLATKDTATVVAVCFALLYWGLWFFYLRDVKRNGHVPQEGERRWWWAIFLGGIFVEPLYFFRFVWPDEPV